MSVSEFVLLKRFATSGDAKAFAEIIRQHAPLVYGVCLRIFADRDMAADAVQDTFLQLAKNADTITGSLPNWLHHVAKNRSIELIRQDSSRKQHEKIYAADSQKKQSQEETVTWQEISTCIDEELDQLDDLTREVIILHFFESQTMTSIAEKFGISQPTVSRRIEEGITTLRHNLKSRGLIAPVTILTALHTENIVKAAPASIMKELGKIALTGSKATIGSKTAEGISRGTAMKMKIIVSVLVILIAVGLVILHYSSSQSEEPTIVQNTSSTSSVTPQRDKELLKIVAQANKENYDSIKTWKGDVNEEINTKEGDILQIKTNVKYEFVFDQSQKAVRWNKNVTETTRIENGIKTVDPYYALKTYSSKMYKDSAYYRYRGNQQPGTPIRFLYILSIEKDWTGSQRANQSETDTIDPQVLLSPFPGKSIYEGLMLYYKDIKETDPNVYIFRKGDIVILQFLIITDVNDRYVFDLSKGGNLVAWPNIANSTENTRKYTYENKSGSWVLKTYYTTNNTKREDISRSSTSTRLLKFENSVVNVPFKNDEFTVEKLGIKQGDLIQDSTSMPPQYIYRGTLH